MNELNALALKYPCPYCGQPMGSWCRTTSGVKYQWLHERRLRSVRQAYHLGREHTWTDLAEWHQSDPKSVTRMIERRIERGSR